MSPYYRCGSGAASSKVVGSLGSVRYLWWSSGSGGDGDDNEDGKKGGSGGRGRAKGKRVGDKGKEDKKKGGEEEEAPLVTTVEGDGRIVDLEEDDDPGRNVSVAANSPEVRSVGLHPPGPRRTAHPWVPG